MVLLKGRLFRTYLLIDVVYRIRIRRTMFTVYPYPRTYQNISLIQPTEHRRLRNCSI